MRMYLDSEGFFYTECLCGVFEIFTQLDKPISPTERDSDEFFEATWVEECDEGFFKKSYHEKTRMNLQLN